MQQVLDNYARVRLANIAAVKPEKAEQLQNIILVICNEEEFKEK